MKQVLVLHWGVNCLDRGNRPIKSRFAPLIVVRIAIVSVTIRAANQKAVGSRSRNRQD
ncbi:hypothetical protein [Burkholderia multivorans]|uniref:hypothetical protein n=1 Tax=Burkholderia multivorans TaxID=87883 RepID=UPI0015E419F4|nr:hypothetical protein [Burkholderia multivorans]MBR7895642.1 hypothetical protein [Burkholderia multivorans]MBU9512263.1 hypothetical protein [Burkholderia multivorans]MBU9528537.1 hypothetical protein [Burkholderia multivorans]MBU9539077.1 hypothetical protein [Burkholderia multivorans]MBU9634017.1 hypothetical protein [Burkholderia multivorans]